MKIISLILMLASFGVHAIERLAPTPSASVPAADPTFVITAR